MSEVKPDFGGKPMGYYRGKRIEDMTREELMDALIEASEMYSDLIKTHAGDMRVLVGLPRKER